MSRVDVPDGTLEGHYAGAVTRLAAYAADVVLIGASYGMILTGLTFVVNVLSRSDEFQAPADTTLPYLVGLVVWVYTYNACSWAMWWKTLGKSLLGLRIVERDGADLRVRTALNRALWWQLCFLVPFSQIGIVIGRERRALHDVIAGTTVVYDWNARDARWRLLARRRIRTGSADEDQVREEAVEHG